MPRQIQDCTCTSRRSRSSKGQNGRGSNATKNQRTTSFDCHFVPNLGRRTQKCNRAARTLVAAPPIGDIRHKLPYISSKVVAITPQATLEPPKSRQHRKTRYKTEQIARTNTHVQHFLCPASQQQPSVDDDNTLKPTMTTSTTLKSSAWVRGEAHTLVVSSVGNVWRQGGQTAQPHGKSYKYSEACLHGGQKLCGRRLEYSRDRQG